jgi:hypothetical protein
VTIGRERELKALRGVVDEGTAGTLLIQGPAGIGKTTLLDAVAAHAAGHGSTILRCRGWFAETPLAHAALGDLFEGVK